MNGTGGIHPFWRALAGAGFGFGIVVVGYAFSFWAALWATIFVVLGAAAGVLVISGD